MNENDIRQILEQVKAGGMSVEEAGQLLHMGRYEEMGYAKLDSKDRIWGSGLLQRKDRRPFGGYL